MDHALLSPDELHLLYILLDSNLPTGGFVSSSGLEVYVKHGFLGISSSDSLYADDLDTKGKGKGTFTAVKGVKDVIRGVTDFADAEVRHYGSTTGCFVKDAWRAVAAARAPEGRGRESTVPGGVDGDDETSAHRAASESRRGRGRVSLDVVLEDIARLDEYHEASMLSHVARRASRAQGVAMLTLFARGLTRPVGFDRLSLQGGAEEEEEEEEDPGAEVVDAYKKLVRKGSVPGHLAVCWGVITASLGLSLDRSIHLYLFLHARSLLSTAVRMNIIGPYASSQMLLHPFKHIIERETARLNDESVTTGLLHRSRSRETEHEDKEEEQEGFWDWTRTAEMGPATTWPLGETLMGRHDMQHSRIFNS